MQWITAHCCSSLRIIVAALLVVPTVASCGSPPCTFHLFSEGILSFRAFNLYYLCINLSRPLGSGGIQHWSPLSLPLSASILGPHSLPAPCFSSPGILRGVLLLPTTRLRCGSLHTAPALFSVALLLLLRASLAAPSSLSYTFFLHAHFSQFPSSLGSSCVC